MDTLIQIQYSALNSVAILHISGIISSCASYFQELEYTYLLNNGIYSFI